MKGKETELKKCLVDLEASQKETKEAYREMLLRLAIAAESKDPDTGAHIMRVSEYSAIIARTLGVSDDEVDIIKYASMMHDIGKIGVPQELLDKPELSSEEFDKIKKHPLIADKIFDGSKSHLVIAARDIALTHHERFDGKGYPAGLKGRDIPLYGRIVTVADSFDAIVSKRSYKTARSFEEAVEILKKDAGTAFDPEIVAAFLKTSDSVKEVLNKYRKK